MIGNPKQAKGYRNWWTSHNASISIASKSPVNRHQGWQYDYPVLASAENTACQFHSSSCFRSWQVWQKVVHAAGIRDIGLRQLPCQHWRNPQQASVGQPIPRGSPDDGRKVRTTPKSGLTTSGALDMASGTIILRIEKSSVKKLWAWAWSSMLGHQQSMDGPESTHCFTRLYAMDPPRSTRRLAQSYDMHLVLSVRDLPWECTMPRRLRRFY